MTPELLGKRWPTMNLALSMLPDGARIVETGCAHTAGDWSGAGLSTVVFADWASKHGGRVYTVDISEAALDAAVELTADYGDTVSFWLRDSVAWLRDSAPQADLLYLDSLDYPYGQMLDAYGGKDDLDMAVALLAAMSEEQVVADWCGIIGPSQEHCADEVRAALPLLGPESLVLIDDADLPGGGKARLARKVLAENGWRCLLEGYQMLWSR